MKLSTVNLPPHVVALNDAATRLKEDRKYLSALTCIRRALALYPNHPVLLGTLGACLWNAGEFGEARAALTSAAAQSSDNATYWAHLALCYASLRMVNDAERAYARALEMRAGDLPILWNRSQFRLSVGNWKEGFDDYESRIPFRGEPSYKTLPYPVWSGEDLNGKTIVVCSEQGVGDTILASRYLSEIKRRYPQSRIVYFVTPRLHDLMWEFRDIVEFWPNGHPWPEADFGIYQMSLPRVLGSAPDGVPQLCGRLRTRALASAKSVKLPELNGPSQFKIGIAWTGNPEMKANEERSIPLELILDHIAVDPRYSLYSLQVGAGSEDLRFVDCPNIVQDCSKELGAYGFAGTAAAMANMDLVLTVCTSNAHLAGSIGVPVWTLLCHDPYWVWGREGETSIWYPSMRLFRQRKQYEWEPVIKVVKSALDEIVQERAAA